MAEASGVEGTLDGRNGEIHEQPQSLDRYGLRRSRSTYEFTGLGARSRRLSQIDETVRALGYSDTEVHTAIERLQDANEEITFDSLIDTAFSVQKELIETGSAPASLELYNETRSKPKLYGTGESYSQNNTDKLDSEVDSSGYNRIDAHHDEELRKKLLRSAIEKKKMELRSAINKLTFQCRVCNCSRATILLLPCGHLASCDDCLMDVRRCPINRCNKVVRGTKEVYFV